MHVQLISNSPYEYSSIGIEYSEMLAAGKLLEKIRRKNSKLADELSQAPVSPVYLQQVLDKMSPPAPKISFPLPPKEKAAAGHIPTLEEVIVIHFNKRQTNEVAATFAVYNGNGGPQGFDIGMTTLRALEAVFRTQGRTIPETEAINSLMMLFLQNISNIRYKRDLLEFLRELPGENEIVHKIVDKLIELCKAA